LERRRVVFWQTGRVFRESASRQHGLTPLRTQVLEWSAGDAQPLFSLPTGAATDGMPPLALPATVSDEWLATSAALPRREVPAPPLPRRRDTLDHPPAVY
jgi:hypothetical protein